MVGLYDVLLRTGNDEIDDHRRTARKSSRSPRLEVFARNGSHKWQLHMRVRIDSARHDVLAASVYDCRAARRIEILADCDDEAVVAKYIGPK